jgi:hypothetical protein
MVIDLRHGPVRDCAFCGSAIAVTVIDPSIAGINAPIDGPLHFWFCHAACFKRAVGDFHPQDIPRVENAKPMDRRYSPWGELHVCGICSNGIEVGGRNPSVMGVQMLDGNWEGCFCHAKCFSERIAGAVRFRPHWRC